MSYTYHFVCFNCKEVLDVGKIVNIDEDGNACRLKFSGWRDLVTGQRIEGTRLLRLIELWQMKHRMHEVRLIPESILDVLDPEGKFIYIDSEKEILDCDVLFEDDELEEELVTNELRKLLK